MPLRIVFMGTPEFAAIVLRRLLAWEGCCVTAAFCQPDRPAGRGHKCTPPPVKVLAQTAGIPVFQPSGFKTEEARRLVADCQPDVLAVAAYGLLLPQAVLDIPRLAPLNVHASLLPRYRGAAPVARAIMEGCTHTGVSIMRMEAGLDTGPYYRTVAVPVERHTAGSLERLLAECGGEALIQVMQDLRDGVAQAISQDAAAASWAAKLSREDGEVDFFRPVRAVDAHIRGVTPRPGARVHLCLPKGIQMRVLLESGCPGDMLPEGVQAGDICVPARGRLAVAAEDALYQVERLRPDGRASMDAAAFVNGFLPGGVRGVVGNVSR